MSLKPVSNPALITTTSLAIATLLPIAAHQLRFLRHLPDPPNPIFASDRITQSKAAHPLGIPDSLLGLASYSVTLTFALLAPAHPTARRLLTFKLAADGAAAGFNVVRQVVTFRKLCSWCTATAICTAAMLLAARSTPSARR